MHCKPLSLIVLVIGITVAVAAFAGTAKASTTASVSATASAGNSDYSLTAPQVVFVQSGQTASINLHAAKYSSGSVDCFIVANGDGVTPYPNYTVWSGPLAPGLDVNTNHVTPAIIKNGKLTADLWCGNDANPWKVVASTTVNIKVRPFGSTGSVQPT
jgi:hypothetical protein